MLVNEQRSIGASGAEAELMKKRCNALVPSAGSLLEPVQGARKQANMLRTSVVDEPRRLLAIDLLLKMTMEERVGDVHLMNQPCTRDRQL